MREAALYARVSTRKQEEEATIESQLDQLQRYVKEHELSLSEAHQYIDQAVSGKRLARPGLDRMRDAVMAGEFGVLLCLSPDRLARNLGAQQVILDEMERYGVEVVFINQPQSSDEPQGKLLLGIQGVFAEYERTVINERMRRGRLYRLRQGQSVTNLAPYGYRYQASDRHHSNAWITVPEEAALVRQIFVDYTTLHLSLGQLQMRINTQNIPSPKGGQWTVSTLGRVLRQPAYKGTACYNYHQLDESTVGKPRRQGPGYLHFPRYKPRPVEDWIWFQVPALVDEALWQAAQERLAMQSRYAPRNSRSPYLLRGLLVCGVCGFTLQARTQKGKVTYYCRHGGCHCPEGVAQHTRSVQAEAIETMVWQSLADLLDNPQQIQEAWQTLQNEQTTEGEYQRLQQRYTQLDKQRQRLLDAYQADLITLDELRQRQNPLDNQLQSIRANLTSYSQPKPQIALGDFTEAIQRALSSCDFNTRQEVIRLLIERIVVTDEALIVEHIIPTMANSRLSLVDHAIRWTWRLLRKDRSQRQLAITFTSNKVAMLDQAIIEQLVQIVGKSGVLKTPEDLAVYSYDGTFEEHRPDVVVLPQTTLQVSQVVSLAGRQRIPVVTRGMGSGLAAASVPFCGGITLAMTRMNHMLEIDQKNAIAHVEAGVVTADLQSQVEKLGLFYPPDPSSIRHSTIGGNIACNAGGPRCLKYGVTGDYVLGLTVVLSDGRVLRTGGKVIKDVVGYDLTALFTGSEGTLCVITEALLKLVARPSYARTALVDFSSINDACRTVNAILTAGILPASLELMDETAIACIEEAMHLGLPLDVEAVLLIETDGSDEAAVVREIEGAAKICGELGARRVKIAKDEAERASLWKARRSVSPSLARKAPNKLGEDITVPRDAIPEAVHRLKEISAKYGLPIVIFGHAGDGNLHPNILFDKRDPEQWRKVELMVGEVFNTSLELGGTLSGEHGVGALKRPYMLRALGPDSIEMQQRIKQAFDPLNILNPGKVLPQP